MPQITAIAINDGKASPATHTFSPVTSNGQKGQLANRSASFPSAFETMELEVVKPATPTGAYRITGKLQLPVTALVNGVDQVVRFIKADVTIHASQGSTAAERKDACALLSNMFANATVKTVVENLEPLY